MIHIQEIADLIININRTFEKVNDVKRNINYLLSLAENRRKYDDVSFEHFQFESFDLIYLKKTLQDLKFKREELEEEYSNLDIDDEDYK